MPAPVDADCGQRGVRAEDKDPSLLSHAGIPNAAQDALTHTQVDEAVVGKPQRKG